MERISHNIGLVHSINKQETKEKTSHISNEHSHVYLRYHHLLLLTFMYIKTFVIFWSSQNSKKNQRKFSQKGKIQRIKIIKCRITFRIDY